jgi:hypothetical protein
MSRIRIPTDQDRAELADRLKETDAWLSEKTSSHPSIQALQTRINAFQLSRFPGQTVSGKLNHLVKELGELRDAPGDITEHADCLILLLGIAALCGFTIDDLLAAARAKMVVNENRQWHAADADGVYRHKDTLP